METRLARAGPWACDADFSSSVSPNNMHDHRHMVQLITSKPRENKPNKPGVTQAAESRSHMDLAWVCACMQWRHA